MDHGKWIADAITTYAVPVSGHSKRLPARNPSDVAPRGLASTWACTAAKALCVMKIGYGEFVGAPSTVGVQRIAVPTGNGRLSSAPPGSAGPPPGRGIASETRARAAVLRTGSILSATLQLPRRRCVATPLKPAAPPRTTTRSEERR